MIFEVFFRGKRIMALEARITLLERRNEALLEGFRQIARDHGVPEPEAWRPSLKAVK